MTISDFFSVSFLFSIAIIIILTGCIYAYINFKMAEQDHKLSSMVNLVSILAQDLHFVKSKINDAQNVDPNILQYSSQLVGGDNISGLIGVSDGEDNEESENDYDNEEYDDEDQDQDQDDDEDQDEDQDEDDEYDDEDQDQDEEDCSAKKTQEHIKLLNLSLANDNIDNDLLIEELNNYSNLDDVKTIYFINEDDKDVIEENDVKEVDVKEDDIKEDDIKEVIDFGPDGTDSVYVTDHKHYLNNLSFVEDITDFTTKPEYKKMSTNKLREVVVSKGIITDASKLKKNEILKLLGDE